jgi:lantibiotic modifying enzyme
MSHPLSDLPDSQYSGFCHGPTGTARTFFELYKITREPRYQALAERLAHAILQRNYPESLTQDYSNTVCQCCGSVAVIDLFIEMWASTGRLEYLASAQRATRQLVRREVNLDGKKYQELPVWTPVKPWGKCAETGYYTGAAGVGAALLHVHLAEQGRYNAIIRLDNPFANIRQA